MFRLLGVDHIGLLGDKLFYSINYNSFNIHELNGEIKYFFEEVHEGEIQKIVILRNGDFLSWCDDGEIKIWNNRCVCSNSFQIDTSSYIIENIFDTENGDIFIVFHYGEVKLWKPKKF